MENQDIFIFTTRNLGQNENELFYDAEKINLENDSNLLGFHRFNLKSTFPKSEIKNLIYIDNKRILSYINELKSNGINDIQIKPILKWFENGAKEDTKEEIKDELEYLIDFYPYFSFTEIFHHKGYLDINLRNRILKIKNKNIFGYRTLDVGKEFEVVGTIKNFIFSLITDISKHMEISVKDLFFKNNLYLFLHDKDIDYKKNDYYLQADEIEKYFLNNNPKLIEVLGKENILSKPEKFSVAIFMHETGQVYNTLKDVSNIERIEIHLKKLAFQLKKNRTK